MSPSKNSVLVANAHNFIKKINCITPMNVYVGWVRPCALNRPMFYFGKILLRV